MRAFGKARHRAAVNGFVFAEFEKGFGSGDAKFVWPESKTAPFGPKRSSFGQNRNRRRSIGAEVRLARIGNGFVLPKLQRRPGRPPVRMETTARRATGHVATAGGENMRRKGNGSYSQYETEHIMNVSFFCQSAK
jgi:hypothetical protein